MKPDHSSAPAERRFDVAGARIAGGYGDLASRAALAALPTALAFMCPFIWAFIVYQILKSSEANRRTYKEVLSAAPGAVVIDDDTIQLQTAGHSLVARDDVLDGWIEQIGAEPYLHVRLSGRRRLLIRPAQHSDAEAILGALGIGVDAQTARFPVISSAVKSGQGAVYHLLGPWLGIPVLAMLAGGLGAFLARGELEGAAMTGVGLVFAMALGMVFARSVRRRQVIVGRDGFTIVHGKKRQFIGFEQVERVETESHEGYRGALPRKRVQAHLRDGETIELACGSFAGDDPDMAGGLYRRLKLALDAYREARNSGEDTVALLERRGRSVKDWIAFLAKLVGEGGDYRAARLNAVHLAEVVEDVTAPVERRLGAAIALSGVDAKPELRKRVRIAANTCAHPNLRIALESASAGALQEAELEAVLEEHGEAETGVAER